MADITPSKRNHILNLSEHCEYTQTSIANIVKVNQKSVPRIIKQQESTGSATPKCKGKCSRKRKTTPKDDTILRRNNKKNPRKTSFDLQKDLVLAGVRTSSSVVKRHLLEPERKGYKI